MNEAAEIAKRLTSTQKKLLLALDGAQYRDWKALSINVRTRNVLASLGLTEMYNQGPVHCYFLRRLSPLGLSVRAVLQQKV